MPGIHFFAALYAGTLTAVLAVPAYEAPIDSLQDLASAHSRGFVIAITRDSSLESAFKVTVHIIVES